MLLGSALGGASCGHLGDQAAGPGGGGAAVGPGGGGGEPPDGGERPDGQEDAHRDAGEDDGGKADDGGDGGDPLPIGRFAIGFWCGVPATELGPSRIDEMATAGFTLVSNACDGTTYVPAYNQSMIALAHARGLEAVVSDQRTLDAVAGTSVAQNLAAVVKDYGALPGLAGYFVTDEPSAPAFPALAAVVSGLAALDPKHYPYINLLPDYASQGQLGAASYDAYVTQFLATVKPPLFSDDYYPFLTGGADMPTFFANLASVRAAALAAGTPFWQFVQSISYGGHRATTGPEKRWAALHALAYGASGISYFTYWTPPQTGEAFGDGIIDGQGHASSQYVDVQGINQALGAMGRYLVVAQSTGVFHNGPLAQGAAPRTPGAPVYVPSPASLTVGLFSVKADAYAVVVNRDYGAVTESDVVLASADGAPEALDLATGHFLPMPLTGAATGGVRVHVKLDPGDGVLLHLRGPVPTGPPGAEAFVGVVRADQGALDVVDSSFGTQRLRTDGWDDCPADYTMLGHDFESNGFWLCARQDLAASVFLVGNVVSDAGTLFRVQGGTATSLGPAGWDTCPTGKLLGHRFESNGYWVCL